MLDQLRILAMSDIHGKEDIVDEFIRWIKNDEETYDIVVVAGDIGNPQRKGSMCKILSKLALKLGKKVIYVRGNWDIEAACKDEPHKIIDLERSGPYKFGPFTLIGHGRRVKPYTLGDYGIRILITHYPPYSIMDKGKKIDNYHQSLHAGIIEINYLLNHYNPLVHIFGHSHSFGGIDLDLNGIRYINVARLDRTTRDGKPIGNYAIITLTNKGKISIQWKFINGIWKKCNGCGKTVHIPQSWSLCRKCAHKNDLRFSRLDPAMSRIRLEIKDPLSSKIFLRKILQIPIHTLKDQTSYEDFIDEIIVRETKTVLSLNHIKVIELSKDKIIEFYGNKNQEMLVPFSEYLFSCNEEIAGRRLCALMKLLSLDKRVHLFWGLQPLKGLDGNYELKEEYVVLNENIICSNPRIPIMLRSVGFRPIVYSKKAIK